MLATPLNHIVLRVNVMVMINRPIVSHLMLHGIFLQNYNISSSLSLLQMTGMLREKVLKITYLNTARTSKKKTVKIQTPHVPSCSLSHTLLLPSFLPLSLSRSLSLYVRVRVRVRVCLHVCLCVRVCARVCMCVCVFACASKLL